MMGTGGPLSSDGPKPLWCSVLADRLWIAVFLALPVVGLVSGPAYAPLLFSVAAISLVCAQINTGRRLEINPELAVLAIGFTVLCWASAAWSIVPARSLSAAGQMTAVLTGALLICSAGRSLPESVTPVLARMVMVGFPIGATVFACDSAFGYPLQGLIGQAAHAATKYNRGIDHYLLLLLPCLGYQVAGRRWIMVAVLGSSGLLTVALGMNTTARVAVIVSIITLGLAWLLPRLTGWLLSAVTVLWMLGLPVFLHLLGVNRDVLFPYIKNSAQHRLEIWDYMSARILERPVLGWGLQSANAVPIHPDELASYKWVSAVGIYPHNQFLQLWLETGVVGALLGLGFLVAVLWLSGKRLSPPMYPFALAAFVFAFCVASTGYPVSTDSWWATLAGSAILFKLLNRMVILNQFTA